jgi:CBS-domain-containing membrane protein
MCSLAANLQRAQGMAPFASANVLANRFLAPLAHPWTAVGGGLVAGGALWGDALVKGTRVALRLLGLLLSL